MSLPSIVKEKVEEMKREKYADHSLITASYFVCNIPLVAELASST